MKDELTFKSFFKYFSLWILIWILVSTWTILIVGGFCFGIYAVTYTLINHEWLNLPLLLACLILSGEMLYKTVGFVKVFLSGIMEDF